MPAVINLNAVWEHTLTNILKHGPKTEVGIILRIWLEYHKLDDFKTLLGWGTENFSPSGPLSTYRTTCSTHI